MSLKQIHDVSESTQTGLVGNKESTQQTDSDTALQRFLNRIPISAIRGIKNSPVLALKTGDSVRDVIHLLFEKNVSGAPIADSGSGGFSEPFIGFIDFATVLLWCLEECDKEENRSRNTGKEEVGNYGFFAMLEQHPQVGQTKTESNQLMVFKVDWYSKYLKIGELAKSFLWDSYFPVHIDETLFHVLLLLSKHRLHVVPVIERTNSQLTGFISEHGVIHLLLQSSGLDWFDSIADKLVSDVRIGSEENLVLVYRDQSIAEALQVLWKNRSCIVAVISRESKRLIGSIMNSNIYLLIENDDIFRSINTLTVEKFILMEPNNRSSDATTDQDPGAVLSAGFLHLKDGFSPRMDSPVTNKRTHTLLQVMRNMADTNSSFSLLVDDLRRPVGLLTLRDVIIHFAPPGIDSSIHGGGFFESALEQSRCHVHNGTIVRDNN